MHYFLILSDEFDSSSAVAIRLKYFYNALLRINDPAQVTIICCGRSNSRNGGVVTLKAMFPGTKKGYQRVFTEISFAIRVAGFFWRKRSGEEQNAIVFSIPFFLAALLSFPFLRGMSSKLILDIRDSYPEAFLDAGIIKPGLIYNIFNAAVRQMLVKADLVVCATEGLKEEIVKLEEISPNKVVTIFNGYPQGFRKVGREKRDIFTCVFHGGLGHYANIDAIGAAAECLLDEGIDFLIIGAGAKESKVKS
jgi:glycosyltransferase involved in cell wall biosynthesis